MNDKIDYQPLVGAEPGQLFRHQDGGYYQLVTCARHTNDLHPVVVYAHVWPFEPSTWVRPIQEWESRFTRCTSAELSDAMLSDRAVAQAKITAAKAARRAASPAV